MRDAYWLTRRPVYQPRLRWLARRVLPLLLRGERVFCPCCGRRFRAFVRRYTAGAAPEYLCPGCLSLRRHRLLWLYLERRTPLPAGHVALLHVSPEECLRERILELPSVRYVSLDMAGDRAMVRGNVASLPFGEAEFDVVLCNHVLEHVADDRGALAELHRVLRLGGTAYIQAPVNPRLTTTLEDRTVAGARERVRRFGQRDHVRVYGTDFVDRLRAAGFDVAVERYADELDADTARACLPGSDPIYVCRKE